MKKPFLCKLYKTEFIQKLKIGIKITKFEIILINKNKKIELCTKKYFHSNK